MGSRLNPRLFQPQRRSQNPLTTKDTKKHKGIAGSARHRRDRMTKRQDPRRPHRSLALLVIKKKRTSCYFVSFVVRVFGLTLCPCGKEHVTKPPKRLFPRR